MRAQQQIVTVAPNATTTVTFMVDKYVSPQNIAYGLSTTGANVQVSYVLLALIPSADSNGNATLAQVPTSQSVSISTPGLVPNNQACDAIQFSVVGGASGGTATITVNQSGITT